MLALYSRVAHTWGGQRQVSRAAEKSYELIKLF